MQPAGIGQGTARPDQTASPLDLLRQELRRRGLDGFVVPRGDEHQGEYVPPSAERLAWLTGFTGSAGVAVVLADRAALFVDGRYTLQARAEVDAGRFSLLHLIDEPPQRWLAANLPAGARLGYDPWLHTPNGVETLRGACEAADATLVAADDNPLDAVWIDRPAPPLGQLAVHAQEFAGRDSADKRDELSHTLAAAKLDAALLSAPDSIAWLLNVRGADVPFTPLPLCFALIHADSTVDLFIDPRKVPGVVAGHLGTAVRPAPPSALGPTLDGLGGKRVRLDPASAPAWALNRLEAAGAQVSRGPDPCALPKACKNALELEGARRAHQRDGAALVRFLAWLSGAAADGTLGEMAAAAQLETFRQDNEHYRGPSFATISGAGANGAVIHYHSSPQTDRPLAPGQLYLVDSGGQYLDGTTDVTRTVAVPSRDPAVSVGAQEKHCFTLVLKGHIALATARFPAGTTGSQLDVLARRALWEHGLDYDHGTGHGVGSYLSVHEGPQRIAKMPNTEPLQPGMILSNEPGYYRPGAFGIRIENLMAVRARQEKSEKPMLEFETLTLAPVDISLIDRSLLDDGEAAWLNAYHARVREVLTPGLDAATARWLAEATRAI